MGFLDTNSRWVDILLTEAGKRSLAEGDLDIRYYSFSDIDNSYLVEGRSGSREWLQEPHTHLMLESGNKPQDRAVIASDNKGNKLTDLEIIVPTDDQLGEYVLASSSESNWDKDLLLNLLESTSEKLRTNCTIKKTIQELDFKLTTNQRIPKSEWEKYQPIPIGSQPPLWNDADATASIQFQYLPPVTGEDSLLGNWPQTTVEPSITKPSFLEKEKLKIATLETSYQEVTIQPFVLSREGFDILTILRAKNEIDENGISVQVWHVGYLYYDSTIPKFIRIFTIMAK
jgi:hypothetical protein